MQAGKRTDALLGLNYLYNSDYRLAIEYSEAVSQDLVGAQLETDSVLTLGIQKSF